MEEIVTRLYQFILFLVNVIKDLVYNVSGRADRDKEKASATNG